MHKDLIRNQDIVWFVYNHDCINGCKLWKRVCSTLIDDKCSLSVCFTVTNKKKTKMCEYVGYRITWASRSLVENLTNARLLLMGPTAGSETRTLLRLFIGTVTVMQAALYKMLNWKTE